MQRLLSLTAISLTVLLPSAFGQTGGRDLYVAKCSACHAPDGSGNSTVGRSLKLDDVRPAINNMTDEQLRQIILEGKGKMPSNKRLDDEKIRSLTLYLRDLAAGHPDTGRAVAEAQAQPLPNVDTVFRDKCSACHGPDGIGRTTIGKSLKIPDLTSAAVQSRSGEELAKIISQGKGRMPAYARKFNPVQVGQLVIHVRALIKKGTEKEPIESATSPVAVPQTPSPPSVQIKTQPATASLVPNPAGKAAVTNSPKQVEMNAVEPKEPKPSTRPAVKKAPMNGRQIYGAKCSACHSSDGSSSGAIGKSMRIPSLISPQAQAQSDETLAQIISNGVGKMPAYKKKFSSDQIQLLVTYIRELGKKH